MSRAVRVWAALGEGEREYVRRSTLTDDFYELAEALDADLAEHERLRAALDAPYPFLIPEHHAGPRRDIQPGQCEACDREVGTGLTAWITDDRQVLLLGPRCWRERSLRRAEGRAGTQLTLDTREDG